MDWIAGWTARRRNQWAMLAVLLGSLAAIVPLDAGVTMSEEMADPTARDYQSEDIRFIEPSNAVNWGSNQHQAEFYLTDPGKSAEPWMPGWTTSKPSGQDEGEQDSSAARDADGGRAGAIPLPNAAWSGLTCLAALTLAGGVRRVRQSLRQITASM